MPIYDELAQYPLRSIALEPALSVAVDATVPAVVDTMHDSGIDYVLVMDGNELAGIFTEHDLLTRAVNADGVPDAPVRQFMTPNPAVLDAALPLSDALETMAEGRYRHLPIGDGEGRLHRRPDHPQCAAFSRRATAGQHPQSAAPTAPDHSRPGRSMMDHTSRSVLERVTVRFRRGFRGRPAGSRVAAYQHLGAVRQRPRHPARLPSRDPCPRRHPARRERLPDQLCERGHPHSRRRTRRAGGAQSPPPPRRTWRISPRAAP